MSTLELDVLNVSSTAEAEKQQAEQPQAAASASAAATGTLIGFKDDGCTPLVLFSGQLGWAAVPAGTVIDLHAAHIGRQVVLIFEGGDPHLPIIIGLLRGPRLWSLIEQPGQIEVDAGGERLIVTAKEQLVLRCGKASITLTKAGKVLIKGAYVSNRSSGVMRIKGGSVQIN